MKAPSYFSKNFNNLITITKTPITLGNKTYRLEFWKLHFMGAGEMPKKVLRKQFLILVM